MSTIQFDFDSIKRRIKNNLSSKSEWANFLDYGVADNIIDAIVQEMAYQMQYDEYLTYENWWDKARNKSSLLVQSEVHGYTVPRKQGAIGTLLVSTDENFSKSHGTDIIIPKYFQFSGNGIYVVSDSSYSFSSSENYVVVNCKQGESKEVKFLAFGNLYEEKFIDDSSIDNDMFDLYVNGILWQRVNTLFECGPEDRVYELKTKSDLSGVTIKFGNNVYGKKLSLNDVVEFKYISTKGVDGNIFMPNIINTVESQGFDVNGKPITLYVKNTTSIVGGKDYPSIDEIRQLSPRVYQSGDRASSKDDYITLIRRFSYISKVNVWGAYEKNKDEGNDPWAFIPSDENVVHVALLDSAYENLSKEFKEKVIEDLHSKNDPTDIIKFETVEKIPLIFNISATVLNSSYSLTQVRADIENMLIENYGIQKMDFNDSIHESDFIRSIDEINGIDYHTSSIFAKKEFGFQNAYYCSFEIPIYPISNVKTYFYIKDTSLPEEDRKYELFASVDVDGNLVSTNIEVYDISDSKLYLSTGKGTLIFNSGLEGDYEKYKIKVVYGLMTNDIILKSRSNILEYDESNISVYYPTN